MNLNDLYEMKDPRDAYERDVANSTSGFGKDSQAYRADGGANDENHALDQQSNTWYIRLNGKLIRDKSGDPYAFQDKAAANKAALTMQAKLFNKDKEFMLTTNPNNKPQGVAEASSNDVEEFLHKVARSGDNGFDMLYNAQQGKYGREIEQAIQDMYDDISIDTGYHGDDDFEQIYDRMLDNIEADYGQQGVAEGHTEVKDKQGKVVSWKDDSEWHRAEKNKQGQPKDPRGVVTHLSDVARRKTAAQQDMDEGVVGNMFNKAKSMFTKPAAAAPPAPVVPNAATQAKIAAAPQGYDPNTGKPLPIAKTTAKLGPGMVKKGGTLDMTKKVVAPAAKPAAAPATPATPAPVGVQGIKSNVDVNTLQKFNGIVDVPPKIKPQIKDAKGRTWTKLTGGWTQDGSTRTIDRQDSTYQSFDDAWRVANGAQPGNVGVTEAEVDSDGYSMDHADSGEYDYEGDQARDQMNTIVRAARRLDGLLDDNENMPEWVQMKVTLAADYLDTAADYIESNQEPELEEGWKEKLGGAALVGAMALGAGGAQARVMPGDDPGINRLTGKPIASQQATDTAPTQPTSSISVAKSQAQYDVDTQTLTYKGKQYKWNSDAQATGQGEVVTAPSMAVGSRSMGSTKVELNPNGTYTKVPANESQEKVGDMDADKFDAAMARLKQLAGAGPLKTVYDPAKRVYRNVPVAVQPRK